jgi:hypothetical protein
LWPLSGVIERDLLPLLASVGQVTIVILIAIMMRGHLLLPEDLFEKDLFSLPNTLGFTGINLLLAPVLLVYVGLAMTSTYLEEQTAGFLRISPVGIYMSERSYQQGNKEIRLAGMMHVGREDYYHDLIDSITAEGTIILAEGVSDRDNLLKHNLDYNRIAKVLGISSQEKMRIDGNLVDLAEFDGEEIVKRGKINKPDVAHADIDINRFEPSTIEFLNALGRTMQSNKPLAEAMVEYNEWVNEQMTPEELAGVMTDILDKRNEVVIASMSKILDHYDTIIIPWGALHMPAIEAAVLEHGFERSQKLERLSLDFRAVPYRELLQKWAGQRHTKQAHPSDSRKIL